MVASLFSNLHLFGGWTGFLGSALLGILQIWMFIDAVRRREWMWAVFIWIFPLINAVLYYFLVYRASTPSSGFELPGAAKRKRIKELQAQIHHIGNAVHYFQLGDIYFGQGKFSLAEASYRASLDRDPKDIDARAHFGQCLLRLNRAAEARPWLEAVCQEDPKHDYGYSMMALAEALGALGEQDAALSAWLKVSAQHSYPRAKVQLAELYVAKGKTKDAQAEIEEVLADDSHAPPFQRRRDRVWIRRARGLSRRIGVS